MSLNILIEVTLIGLLVVLNGLFAMSEIAVVSARTLRLKELARDGDPRAEAALKLASQPTEFLATVQIGITLIGILAGALGGATLAEEVGALLGQIAVLAPYSEELAFASVVVLVTYVSLVVGELTPKRIALRNPERIAILVARPLSTLTRITRPLVKLLSLSTRVLTFVVGGRISEEPDLTEDDVRMMIQQGTETGVFKATERTILERVMSTADLEVGALMIPRTKVVGLDLANSLADNIEQMTACRYSYLPVFEGDDQYVVGVVSAKETWARMLQVGEIRCLCLHPTIYMPENAPALQILEAFQSDRIHIVTVINEHGDFEGIVTPGDMLEALVGDVSQTTDELPEPDAVLVAEGVWLVDGLMPVDMLDELLDVSFESERKSGHYRTVGGFVMMQLGRIPKRSDGFEWQGLHFRVADMDRYRVDQVLIAKGSLRERQTK